MDANDIIIEIEERLNDTNDPFRKAEYKLYIRMIEEARFNITMLQSVEKDDKIEFAGNIISRTGYDEDIPQNHISYELSIKFFHLLNEIIPGIISTNESILKKVYQEGINRDISEDMFVSIKSYGKDIISDLQSKDTPFYDIGIIELQETLKYSYDYEKAPTIKVKEAFGLLTRYYPEKFKIDGNKYFILNPDFSKDETEKFKIKAKKPFYQDNPDYDPKHKFIKFLNESRQVPLNPNMLLVPFKVKTIDERKFKTIYYYFTVNNRSESINLRFTDTGFEYANQQSNFYYQLRSAITPEFRKDYHNFEEYIFKQLQTATGFNTKLMKKIYGSSKDIINNKYIDLTQTEM